MHDTKAALEAYREATVPDPDAPEGWNQLGHLLHRVGQLDEAEAAYQTVLKLAGSERTWQAAALGNLGITAETRGDLKEARRLWEQSLALYTEMGSAPMVDQVQGCLDSLEQ